MRFLYPPLFWTWAPLVLVPVVLYLFRPRPRTVRTSTLPFFKWLAREHHDSAWLKWLKHLLSLLLSILVILGTAGALARLVVAPAAESLKTVVILVDRSASMAARDADGESRLDEALALAEQRLAGLPAGIGVVVMAYDRRPEVLLSRSIDHRKVQRALASIEVYPTEGDPHAGLRLARQLAGLESPASIWHVTDAPVESAEGDSENVPSENPNSEDPAAEVPRLASGPADQPPEPDNLAKLTVEHLCVALPEPVNVGITGFDLGRLPLNRTQFEVFVQVHCAAPEPVEAELEMKLDGVPVAIRYLTLQPGGKQKPSMPPIDVKQDRDQVLTLKVSAPGDVLALDNVVHARIPRARPVKVLWISQSPDLFTEMALASLGTDEDFEVLQGPPSAWPPKEPADATIFDGWLPQEWPAEGSVIVINPPGPLGPLRAKRIEGVGLPLDTLRATNKGHPLLYGVATGRIALTQTAVVEAAGPLRSLWAGSAGPVLLAGEARGQRIVVLAFSPQHSERLPLMYSYPLLIGNAIYWAAEKQIESSRGTNRRTGELVELEGKEITWRNPGNKQSAETSVELKGRSTQLDRIGLWETDAGETGSASLLSTKDTLLPAEDRNPDTAQRDSTAASLFRGDLAPLLLWSVLVLLIVESWLFHRYVAY